MQTRAIRFNKTNRSKFYITLKSRINNYFENKNISKHANSLMLFKSAIFLLGFIGSYILIMTNKLSLLSMLGLVAIMGISAACILFNIAHDAIHNAYSSKRIIKRILSLSLNLVGANSYIFSLKHTLSHHPYPNVPGTDVDIDPSPLMRFSPKTPLYKIHRYQHLYVPLLYMFFSLSVVFVRDFHQFSLRKLGNLENVRHPLKEVIILFSSKAFYFMYILVLPIMFLSVVWWQILIGFFVMHLFSSLLLSIALIPVHLVEGIEFYEPDRNGNIDNDWVIHQIETTTDFARKSKLANWFFGGLNTHAIHHLFPSICHIHYIPLSQILKDTAKEFDINYKETSCWGAIRSHLRFLRRAGRVEDFSSSSGKQNVVLKMAKE